MEEEGQNPSTTNPTMRVTFPQTLIGLRLAMAVADGEREDMVKGFFVEVLPRRWQSKGLIPEKIRGLL